jgi:hypothetical protein
MNSLGNPSSDTLQSGREAFAALAELLTPLLRSENDQKTLVMGVFWGTPIVNQFKFGESAQSFAQNLLLKALEHGKIESKYVLDILTDYIEKQHLMGDDKVQRIQELAQILITTTFETSTRPKMNSGTPHATSEIEHSVTGTSKGREIDVNVGTLQIQFPDAVVCGVIKERKAVQIGRIEVKNGGKKAIPAGWRAKIGLLRPINFRITLTDAIILPTIQPGSVVPMGPFIVEVPHDTFASKDLWNIELYVLDPNGSERLLFRSASLSFA